MYNAAHMNMFRTLGYWSCTLAACCLAFSLTSCQKGKGGAAASADEQDEIYSLQTGNYFLPEGIVAAKIQFHIDGVKELNLQIGDAEGHGDSWTAKVHGGSLVLEDELSGMTYEILNCDISKGDITQKVSTDNIIRLDIELDGRSIKDGTTYHITITDMQIKLDEPYRQAGDIIWTGTMGYGTTPGASGYKHFNPSGTGKVFLTWW